MKKMKLSTNKKYEFDITVNSDTYAGVHSLPYVTAALRSPDTVAKGYVRTIETETFLKTLEISYYK